MADILPNVGLARAAELYIRVDTADPVNCVFTVAALITTALDATLRDLETLALVIADVSTIEATNVGYVRKNIVAADIVAFAPDHVNDRVNLIIPNQTWTGVAAGDNWTDLAICYNPDSTLNDDTLAIPLAIADFAVTTDGSDVSTTFNVLGFLQASQV